MAGWLAQTTGANMKNVIFATPSFSASLSVIVACGLILSICVERRSLDS
jgi:hypothetical protein